METKMTPSPQDFLRLAEELEAYWKRAIGKDDASFYAHAYDHYEDILAALRLAAQAEEWKRDAERYRWIRNVPTVGKIPIPLFETVTGTGTWSDDGWQLKRGSALDVAIDAALAAEEKTP